MTIAQIFLSLCQRAATYLFKSAFFFLFLQKISLWTAFPWYTGYQKYKCKKTR